MPINPLDTQLNDLNALKHKLLRSQSDVEQKRMKNVISMKDAANLLRTIEEKVDMIDEKIRKLQLAKVQQLAQQRTKPKVLGKPVPPNPDVDVKGYKGEDLEPIDDDALDEPAELPDGSPTSIDEPEELPDGSKTEEADTEEGDSFSEAVTDSPDDSKKSEPKKLIRSFNELSKDEKKAAGKWLMEVLIAITGYSKKNIKLLLK